MRLKKLLTTIAILFAVLLQAGHEKGGIIISYKSLLASTGDSLKYAVTVYSIFDKQGPAAPVSLNVNLTSSCFTTSNITLPRTANSTNLLPLLGADYCSTTSSINSNYGMAVYSDTIVLPGKCADFRFAHASGFSRYSGTMNIQNGFQTAYFFTDLNNIHGPNSVPITSINNLILAACLNKPLNLYGFSEADGDSVAYLVGSPSYLSGSNVVSFNYNAGYSIANPVNSTSGYSVNLNTGLVQTQLNSVGSFVLTIRYKEYRKDTANNSVLVSRGKYIMYLVGSSACNSAPFNLAHLNSSTADSINCGQSEIKLKSTRKIAANSLTNNGSEFVVTSSKHGALSINNASISADTIIKLNLTQNISASDTLWIWSKNGTDSDVLFSQCGKEITAFQDTLVYYTAISTSPSAQFSYSSTALNVNYNTTLPADSVIWDFGDGSPTSFNFNPSHQYPSSGIYSVKLVVFNVCGLSDTSVQSVLICDSISSGINYSLNGDSVLFDVINSSNQDTYLWDLGNGSISYDTSFVYQYSSTGIYNVKLLVVNACGDSVTYSVNVAFCINSEAIWTAAVQSSGGSGMLVNFDGTKSKGASNFVWDFGDGNFNSTSLSPSHNYVTPNLAYIIKFTVSNNCGDSDSLEYSLGQIGINESSQKPSLVFPNPTSGKINIVGLANNRLQSIEAYSQKGVLVYKKLSEKNIDSEIIDAREWKNGNYILKLKYKDQIEVLKVTVLK